MSRGLIIIRPNNNYLIIVRSLLNHEFKFQFRDSMVTKRSQFFATRSYFPRKKKGRNDANNKEHVAFCILDIYIFNVKNIGI